MALEPRTRTGLWTAAAVPTPDRPPSQDSSTPTRTSRRAAIRSPRAQELARAHPRLRPGAWKVIPGASGCVESFLIGESSGRGRRGRILRPVRRPRPVVLRGPFLRGPFFRERGGSGAPRRGPGAGETPWDRSGRRGSVLPRARRGRRSGHRGRRGDRPARRPARGHPPRPVRASRLSKSATKAPTEPERRKRIVDIPRFHPRSIPTRGAFVADLDTPPPWVATGVPPAPLDDPRITFIISLPRNAPRRPLNNLPGHHVASPVIQRSSRGTMWRYGSVTSVAWKILRLPRPSTVTPTSI